MKKILIVDDDDAMRRLIRLNLEGEYEIVDTGEPENALALTLQQKPDVILLDLRMPSYSGYELCQTFTSLNSTQLILVFVISGEVGGKTRELCQKLGAAAFFEKPVDFDRLRVSIAEYLKIRRLERRSEARVHLRVAVKLRAAEERACGESPHQAHGRFRNGISEVCTALRGSACGVGPELISLYKVGPGIKFHLWNLAPGPGLEPE